MVFSDYTPTQSIRQARCNHSHLIIGQPVIIVESSEYSDTTMLFHEFFRELPVQFPAIDVMMNQLHKFIFIKWFAQYCEVTS